MQQDNLYFTAGQFARLHNLNKRTLHYYDEIGLFSPAVKGSNGYRYYTWRQSMELENILALREIGMSIGELQDYLKNPSPQKFSELALQKTSEIDRQIKHLRQLKTLLHQKQKALKTCEEIYDGKIEVEHRPSGSMLLTPILAAENTPGNAEQVMAHLKAAWAYSFHKAGCGSYISLEKVSRGQYNYDGLFTPVPR